MRLMTWRALSIRPYTEGGESRSARRCTFMDLALAMVPGLDAAARDLVFKAAKPATTEPDAAVQKRAYKLLASLMKPAAGPGGGIAGRAAATPSLTVRA
jgi:ribosomal RNA-processing protein 12